MGKKIEVDLRDLEILDLILRFIPLLLVQVVLVHIVFLAFEDLKIAFSFRIGVGPPAPVVEQLEE